MVNTTKKYAWTDVQEYYDNGKTWRDVCTRFGMAFQTLVKAQKRGDFQGRDRSAAGILSHQNGRSGLPPMSDERRQALSEEQSLRNRGGRCKWFDVGGVFVQGTWERDAALKLTEMGVKWTKVGKTKDQIMWYVLEGRRHAYTPDFYLPDFDIYLEFKGYWWGRDREKMKAVITQHPNVHIVIVEKSLFDRLMTGEQVW